MNNNCGIPNCHYLKKKDKCVKPNKYIEYISWCKRNNIKHNTCKDDYKKTYKDVNDINDTCNKYIERILEQFKKLKVGPKLKAISKSKPKMDVKMDVKKDVKMKDSIKSDSKMKDAVIKREPMEMTSSLKQKIELFKRKRAANKIKKFLKPFTKRVSDKISDRVGYYKLIRKYLSDLDKEQCLIKTSKYLKIQDKLLLPKRIGSESVYGIVYKSKGKNTGELFRVATKLMKIEKDNTNEISVTDFLSKKVINNKTIHFPLHYKSFKCLKPENNNDFPHLIKKKYYIFINELFNGDLRTFLESNVDNVITDNIKLLENTLMQVILCLFTLNNAGYIHNDSHDGNYLYMKVKPGGYIHYNIFGEDLYLENMGYIWVIWDFAYSELITKDYLLDYKILKFFMNVENGGVVGLETPLRIKNSRHIKNMKLIQEKVSEVSKLEELNSSHINFMCDKYMMTKKQLPSNAVIINSSPYILKTLKYKDQLR